MEGEKPRVKDTEREMTFKGVHKVAGLINLDLMEGVH